MIIGTMIIRFIFLSKLFLLLHIYNTNIKGEGLEIYISSNRKCSRMSDYKKICSDQVMAKLWSEYRYFGEIVCEFVFIKERETPRPIIFYKHFSMMNSKNVLIICKPILTISSKVIAKISL